MKVIFPQNIQKGFFSGMGISIMGFTISLLQMAILALGAVVALAVFSSLSKGGAQALGLILAVIIFLIFIVITFFKVSEMGLLEFVAKKVRDVFFDTAEKKQVNYKKPHPTDVLIAKNRTEQSKQKIELKTSINLDKIQELEGG